MKGITFAATAALVGSAAAGSHVAKHQQFHARDWTDWNSASSAPVKSSPVSAVTPTSPASVVTPTSPTEPWTSPAAPTTPVSPASSSPTAPKSTWSEPASSSSPVSPVKSSSTPSAPASTASTTWADWSSTSADPVKTTSTSSSETWSDWSSTAADPTTTSSASTTWADWSSTQADPATTSSSETWADWSSTQADPATTSSSETWADWSSTQADPATTSSSSWADWSSPADPATTSSSSWADWSAASSIPVQSVTVVPVQSSVAPASSGNNGWGSNSGPADTTTTIHSTSTTTIYVEPASSSSWADWSASSSATTPVQPTNTGNGQCVISVITSYGAPTWSPTPAGGASSPAASGPWTTVTPVTTVYVTPTGAASSPAWSAPASSAVSSAVSSAPAWSAPASSPASPASSAASSGWGQGFYSASPSASGSWPSSSSSSSGSGSGLQANGNYFGMTYSPYSSGGGCKDAGTVASDIAQIKSKGFAFVRVYSTDCSTLQNVGSAARDNGLKLILGVFISSTGISGAGQQVTDITSWAQWDLVELIVVGNEAAFNGYCSASDLAGFIGSSKSQFQAAGYSGPVTTTEPLSEWQSSGSAFCGVVDVVAANLYAFFNAQTSADQAGSFIQSEINILEGICSGKDTYVMETGWPTAGDANGAAIPSPQNQATALQGILNTSGSKVVFFSFEDDAWKAPGQFDVEQHWGCINAF